MVNNLGLRKIFVLLLLVVFASSLVALSGCGSQGRSNSEQADDLVEQAYDECANRDLDTAIEKVEESLNYEVNQKAMLLKACLQYILASNVGEGTEEAYITLTSCEAEFSAYGAANLLRAYFLTIDSSDEGEQIANQLITAHNRDYAGIGYDCFWTMVESFEGFSYFRENFPTQYASLEALKTVAPESLLGGDGETKFSKGVIGPKLYIKHADMYKLEIAEQCKALLASLLPKPYSTLVAHAIRTRLPITKAKDKGRGVILNWTWANWAGVLVEGYWVTSQ